MSAEAAPTLAASARAGARWTAGAFYANTAVRLAISVGLARLLAPADFGVMALTMAFIGFVGLFQDSGLSSALVQHPDPVAPAASTAMVLTTTGGVLLCAASWVLAPWVAGFMENEAVTPVLRVLAVLFVIRGLANPRRALVQRALGFRTLAGVELAGTAAYGALGITLAAAGIGVWALVVAHLVSETIAAVVMWRAAGIRLRIADFDLQAARRLGGFGRYMVAAGVLGMLHMQLPTILVGKTMGAEVLGLYWLAFRWAQLPIGGLTYVAGRVAYPVYARLRDERERFAAGYLQVLQTIVVLALPTCIGLVLVAEPLVATLYDARWQVAVQPLRLLAFYALFAAVAATTGEVFKGAGIPRYVTLYAVLYNVVLGASLLVLRKYGLEGIAAGTVLAPLAVAVVSLRHVAIVLGIAPRSMLAVFASPLQGSLGMAVAVIGTSRLLAQAGAGSTVQLVVEVAAGALTYGAMLYRAEPAWWHEAASTAGLPRLRPRRGMQGDAVH